MILDSNPPKLPKNAHETTIACNNLTAILASFAGAKPFCGDVGTMGRQKKGEHFLQISSCTFF
jgi:hypothetical protein